MNSRDNKAASSRNLSRSSSADKSQQQPTRTNQLSTKSSNKHQTNPNSSSTGHEKSKRPTPKKKINPTSNETPRSSINLKNKSDQKCTTNVSSLNTGIISSKTKNKQKLHSKPLADLNKDSEIREMATNSAHYSLLDSESNKNAIEEKETDLDDDSIVENSSTSTIKSSPLHTESNRNKINQIDAKEPLPTGWEEHIDKSGPYFWHITTGVIQRNRPTDVNNKTNKESILVYCDDDEINVNTSKRSSIDATDFDDEEFYDLNSTGAALTIADDTTLCEETTFVVYPLGCCEFDETQLVSTTSTKAIQKCILKMLNRPPSTEDEVVCWGLTQSQPVLLKLIENHITFTDITSKTLLRSQPIPTIKTWAVDDDNNFAFVIEDRPDQVTQSTYEDYMDSVDYALLSEPTLICYVFHSPEDNDMSIKVAAKLTEEINRYKEQLSNRMSKSTRVQQMRVEHQPLKGKLVIDDDGTDIDEDFNAANEVEDDEDELAANNEMTMSVKYIGKTSVPRPSGIEVLNVAIDKCLAEASKAQMNRCLKEQENDNDTELEEPLTEAKLHVSPSSVIVENTSTGEIIVECRIRFLTFMGISKRDIRWCGFIMQNTTNKTFVAHCFECHPTAGHVCEAIQLSCSRMYEKILKTSSHRHQPETTSIIPSRSQIRTTLAKTFSRIKLNPLVSNSSH